MSLTRIHHVALVVADADRALRFYRDLLGLPVAVDRVIEDQGVRGVLLPMPGGDGASACEIEIIQPVRDDTGVAKFLDAQGEGLHHVCLQSTDVAADLRAARDAGLRMIDETPRDGLAGRIGFLHPKSNHGILIEFAQPPAGAPHPPGRPAGPVGPAGLDHLVAAVHDPAAVAARFQQRFGFRETGALRQPALNVESRLLDLGGSVLEFAAPIDSAASDPLTRRLDRGEGLFMVALGVGDVAAAVAHLRAAGVKCTDPAVIDGQPRSFLSPRPAHGVRLQLVGS
ncbi:MAG: VOC family protein [Chloroflexi bacterium]|nr:VOC family protein [Chloroflexota bacterium]